MDEMEEWLRDNRPKGKKKKNDYRELQDEREIQWDTGGTAIAGGGGDTVKRSKATDEGERVPEEPPAGEQKETEAESNKSPMDPFKPIRLKLIPRNVQIGRCGSNVNSNSAAATTGAGFNSQTQRPPQLPPPSLPVNASFGVNSGGNSSRAPHTAVLHSSGIHTLFRNPAVPSQQGLQTPLWGPSAALRYGRRCSSPQPPLLSGCTPYVSARMPPRSAQTSPSAPKSPKLTSSSSDPWSTIITKTGRAQSIGGGAPPGEMEWLAAPSPRSRKGSWSSVSTDCDSSPPCW
ncbi:uncharacterized protein [Macrobrachium rosenbergii]|uniref:uncharacterized protein n=1 Tax=Macrobrachium rosenbergii TaxID=79674 RepID=UPI0034D5401C